MIFSYSFLEYCLFKIQNSLCFSPIQPKQFLQPIKFEEISLLFLPEEVEVIKKTLEAIKGVHRVKDMEVVDPEGMGFQVIAANDVRGDLFRVAADRGLLVLELGREASSLEEVFQRLTVQAPPPGGDTSIPAPA